MFKNLMNGSSLLAIARFDKDADERAALRAKLAADAKVEAVSDTERQAREANDNDNDEEDNDKGEEEGNEEEGGEGEEDEEDGEEHDAPKKVEETEEQKVEREKQEKIAAKAKRKTERMQARIDEATRLKNEAIAERDRLKAQLEANPDQKLTEEEVEARAEAKAAQKLAEENLKKLQDDFDKDCAALRKAALAKDEKFDDKIADITDQFGKIPSFMIGVLSDLDNGGEVLAYLANDDEEAERIWDLKGKPAKMSNELVLLSQKLKPAPKKKEISKVKAIDPVRNNGRASQSTVITEADTKNMPNYVAKRIAQREAQRKARGY